MVLKATVVLIAIGLSGSGIVALTRSAEEPQLAASAPKVAAPYGATTASVLPNEAFQRGYVQARFAAQRPFAGFSAASR